MSKNIRNIIREEIERQIKDIEDANKKIIEDELNNNIEEELSDEEIKEMFGIKDMVSNIVNKIENNINNNDIDNEIDNDIDDDMDKIDRQINEEINKAKAEIIERNSELVRIDNIDWKRIERSFNYRENIDVITKFRNEDGDLSVFAIVLNTEKMIEYNVYIMKTDDGYFARCDCPDFEFRGSENRIPCKHILAVMRELDLPIII